MSSPILKEPLDKIWFWYLFKELGIYGLEGFARNTYFYSFPFALDGWFIGFEFCSVCPMYMKFKMKVNVLVVDIEYLCIF